MTGTRRATARKGRDVARLLGDFGHQLPSRPPAEPDAKEPTLFDRAVSPRGRWSRSSGWAAVPAPPTAYRMTSDQTPMLWPFVAARGLPPTGAVMGVDVSSGSAFHVDPMGWVKDPAVAGVTAPNIALFGKPGRGKSGTVKSLCLRMMPYGYRSFINGDTKDEYEPLCRLLGVEPFKIGPGMPARVNPLDFGPLGHNWDNLATSERQRRATLIFSRWLVLLPALVGAQGVPFTPTDGQVLSEALHMLTGYAQGSDVLRPVTIPELHHALMNPDPALVAACRYSSTQHFLDETRPVRDALGALVNDHLAGMFDAHTTIEVDWRAPIQSLSLSRLEPLGDQAMGIALTCLNSWSRAMTEIAEEGDLRIIVRDEVWKQLRLGAEAVKSLDADLRLSRRDAAIQVILAHKPSDFESVGEGGSQAVAIARDMLQLIDTKALLGQDQEVGDELGRLLGLSDLEQEVITGWSMEKTGRALWVVGNHKAKVESVRTPVEVALTDTNEKLQKA